jgi:hypothetical protein
VRLALVALALAIAACSMSHRSEEYACANPSDCRGGRHCIDGFCVVSSAIDASRIDARKPIDAQTCPSPCTSCNDANKTCTVDCSMTTACAGQVTCPSGYHCDILCNTDNSCRSGINCQVAAACQITCSGQNACRGVQCGTRSGPSR